MLLVVLRRADSWVMALCVRPKQYKVHQLGQLSNSFRNNPEDLKRETLSCMIEREVSFVANGLRGWRTAARWKYSSVSHLLAGKNVSLANVFCTQGSLKTLLHPESC